MQILTGIVSSRHGIATGNLAPLVGKIAARIGLPALISGTLNVTLPEPYIVTPDGVINPEEYNYKETLKLQRCRVRHLRCCIMRPDSHELNIDASRVLEIMSNVVLRQELRLNDGDSLAIEICGGIDWWEV